MIAQLEPSRITLNSSNLTKEKETSDGSSGSEEGREEMGKEMTRKK